MINLMKYILASWALVTALFLASPPHHMPFWRALAIGLLCGFTVTITRK